MIDYESGDLRIMRAIESHGYGVTWVDEGEMVLCADCVNWGETAPEGAQGWCPIVRKCTKHADWCCWGAKRGESK